MTYKDKIAHRVVTSTVKILTRILCQIDASQLARVPAEGPLIVVGNHVNFFDVPVVYTHLQPRKMTGYAKSEVWDNPALGWLFTLWGAIPLHRGEADMAAIRRGLAVLDAGHILAVAPEGTRSGHGRLQRGHAGVVILALRSGAPLLPIALHGSENYREELSRLRRTSVNITVGRPFYLHAAGIKVTAGVRQRMVDEIMYQLAALLPITYRGYYSDLYSATEEFIRFPAAFP